MKLSYPTLLALAISSSLVITGCNQSTDQAEVNLTEYGNSDAQNPATLTTKTPNIATPAGIQQRKLVKSARINFEVKNIEATTQKITEKVAEINGYIEQQNISYHVESSENKPRIDGRIEVFEKVIPTTHLVVRVPNAQVSAFLQQLKPLVLNFGDQKYEAKRYKLKLLEEQIQTAQSSQVEADSHLSQDLQRLTADEAQDRLQYSTIDIEYYQAAQLRQRQDIDIQNIAKQHPDALADRLWHAVKRGLIGMREALVLVVTLWPLYVVLGLAWLLRRLWLRRRKLAANAPLLQKNESDAAVTDPATNELEQTHQPQEDAQSTAAESELNDKPESGSTSSDSDVKPDSKP